MNRRGFFGTLIGAAGAPLAAREIGASASPWTGIHTTQTALKYTMGESEVEEFALRHMRPAMMAWANQIDLDIMTNFLNPINSPYFYRPSSLMMRKGFNPARLPA